MDHVFFKDGDYHAEGGIYVKNDLFKFFKILTEKGIRPVGIIVDDSWNMQIIVEKNEAYLKHKELTNGQNPETEIKK